MKITYETFSEDRNTHDVEDFIVREMSSGADGRLERTTEETDNVARALGRLVDILARKKSLDAKDICQIAGAYTAAENKPVLEE